MPKLKRTTYRVELETTDPAEPLIFEVTPILADILRAELEGPRHGINDPVRQSVHTTVLWLWSAAVRTGEFAGNFQTFKAACTNFEVVKATDAEVQGVPPTVADSPSDPHSSLPAHSATPATPPRGSSSSTPPPPPKGSAARSRRPR
jgi:hypothetical protein